MIEKPLNLITPRRLDIGAKLLFADAALGNLEQKKWAENIYLDTIKCLTLNSYTEHQSTKESKDCYLRDFYTLLENLKNERFDENYPIPVNKGIIVNGAHRLACALHFKYDFVPLIENSEIDAPTYDFDFFKSRNCLQSSMFEATAKIAEYNPYVRVAIVWPRGNKHLRWILSQFGPQYYRDSFKFSLIGLRNLVAMIYEGEDWLGDEKNNFHGAHSKALECFTNSNVDTTFIVYDKRFVEDGFKQIIRNQMQIGKSGIHTTDTIDETLNVLTNILAPGKFHFIEKIPDKFSNSYCEAVDLLKAWVKNYPDQPYIVDGGQVLNLFNLRASKDVDLITDLKAPFKYKLKHVDLRSGREYDELFYNLNRSQNRSDYFKFNGITYLSPSKLIDLKKERYELNGDKKDKLDLELIQNFFDYDDASKRVSRPDIFYTFLRIRKNIRRLLISFLKASKLINFAIKIKRILY